MKLIGIEEHFLTAEIRDAWYSIGLGVTAPSVAFHGGGIEARLLDLADDRLATMVGTDRLLFSTDFPYQYRPGGDARRFLNECGLARSAKAGFAYGNWMRLTRELGLIQK
jgi:hypothetical protein